jgi:hypothetical protein
METPTLAPFVCQWAVLLVTYMRDSTPVGTPPVSIAVEGIAPSYSPGTQPGS